MERLSTPRLGKGVLTLKAWRQANSHRQEEAEIEMATAKQTITAEEFYANNEIEPEPDFLDGKIEERGMPTHDHGAWQIAIAAFFLAHAKEWNIRVYPELRISVGENRRRNADVAIQSRDFDKDHAPIAVFEVLSPDDRHSRLMRKLKDYQRIGVQQILVVDPEDKTFMRYEKGDTFLAKAERFELGNIKFATAEIQAYLQD
jgi:Uma2 family endonuclease